MASFSINTVVVSGNLTRDPELRTVPSGDSVCSFSIAYNERVKDGNDWTDRPSYFDCTLWGGVGEWLANNIRQGDRVTVQGRLRQDRWEKDGQKRSAVKIIVSGVTAAPREDRPQQQSRARQQQSDIPSDYGLPPQQQAAPRPSQSDFGLPQPQPQRQAGPYADEDDIPFKSRFPTDPAEVVDEWTHLKGTRRA